MGFWEQEINISFGMVALAFAWDVVRRYLDLKYGITLKDKAEAYKFVRDGLIQDAPKINYIYQKFRGNRSIPFEPVPPIPHGEQKADEKVITEALWVSDFTFKFNELQQRQTSVEEKLDLILGKLDMMNGS